jgi:NRPS condensation-like uncharacterized protein
MENKSQYNSTKIEFPKLPEAITNYFEYIKKMYDNYINSIRPTFNRTINNPEIIPANGYDIYNYLAKYGMASFQIQIIMKLDGKLDFERLERAVRLSFDVEPIFGCRFVNSNPPHWKPFEDIDNIKFCTLNKTQNPEVSIQKFLESPMDMDKDPMIMIEVIRSENYDALALKINHVCCDGAGVKDYIKLLSDIYTGITSEDENFVPTPSVRDSKDHKNLLSTLSTFNPMASYTILQQVPLTTWNFPWNNIKMGDTGFITCRLPHGFLNVLNTYAKARGATINDLLLTAIYRAMFDISKPPFGMPMDVAITTDLRKYLPDKRAQAIRNFSSGVTLKICRKANELFEETLSRVVEATKNIKNRHPSLLNAIRVEYLEKMNFYQICAYYNALSQIMDLIAQNPFFVMNRCSPVLSNIGYASKSLIKFGENTVTDFNCFPPAIRAPGILIVASTYNEIINLSIGYYKPSVQRTNIENILNKIRDELIQSCSC